MCAVNVEYSEDISLISDEKCDSTYWSRTKKAYFFVLNLTPNFNYL